MADKIPEHRRAVSVRTGDTHVIGKSGKAQNVDQPVRAAALKVKVKAKEQAAKAAKRARTASKAAGKPAPLQDTDQAKSSAVR